MKVTLTEPGIAGSYVIEERREDGRIVLRREPELLSDVIRETKGQVFHDEEYVAHLERVVATKDDLPSNAEG